MLENLSQMEMALAWQVLRQVAPTTAVSEEIFRRDRPAIRVDAMESYVRGLMTASTDQKTKFFTQAARLDDHFSQPDYELGRMLFAKKDYHGAANWLVKVTRPDSHYMEASFQLGICRYYEGDYDAAIRLFRMVSEEVPLNKVLNNLAVALPSRRNDASAAAGFQKALEGDEGDPDYWFNYGYALWKLGQYSQAADQFRAVLQRSPDDTEATSFLGRCLHSDPYRVGDPKTDGRERIKTLFEDSAYRQLRAELKKYGRDDEKSLMSSDLKNETVVIDAPLSPEYAAILTPEAVAFVVALHRKFNPRRQELLARKRRKAGAHRRRPVTRFSAGDRTHPQQRVGSRADPEGPHRPANGNHRPGGSQDDHQRPEFRREHVHGGSGRFQLANVGQHRRRPDQSA